MEMLPIKCQLAKRCQSIFLPEQDRNVVDVLTTLTSFFPNVPRNDHSTEGKDERRYASGASTKRPPAERPAVLLCQKYTLTTFCESAYLFLVKIMFKTLKSDDVSRVGILFFDVLLPTRFNKNGLDRLFNKLPKLLICLNFFISEDKQL